MKKPFGYTPYGPVTAVCLNVKLHHSVNASEKLAHFSMIELRALRTLNNLSRIEGCLENHQFNSFCIALDELKLKSKIAFLQDELEINQSLCVTAPRVVGHINLDELDDDLPF